MGIGIPRPPLRIQHVVHPGTERWVPSPEVTRRLSELMKLPVVVEWIPRSWISQLWARDFAGKPFPGNYAFRAYSRGQNTKILVDDTETPESATWLLLHELAHTQLPTEPRLVEGYRNQPRPARYLQTDEGHEAAPEEQLANATADHWATKLGSRPGLNRTWWRQRAPR